MKLKLRISLVEDTVNSEIAKSDTLVQEVYASCSDSVFLCVQSLQVAQKEAQIRLLEGQLRQTDMIGSSHNHMILDALREKAEYIPELQALIHNVQQGVVAGD